MLAQSFIATGDYIFFFREGDAFTSPTAGTCSVSSKPGPLDVGWISLGIIGEHEDKPDGVKKEEVWGPTGASGLLTKQRNVITKIGLAFDFTCEEVTPLAIQAFYFSGNLNPNNTWGATQFNQMSGAPPHGWMKVQRYDQNANPVFVMDQWGLLEVTGGMKSGEGSLIKPQFSLGAEYSTLNTAAI